MGLGAVPLNVDAEPTILPDGKIRLRVNLQYRSSRPRRRPSPILKTGTIAGDVDPRKSVGGRRRAASRCVAAQSSDPIGDRQVTVEVKATVMR